MRGNTLGGVPAVLHIGAMSSCSDFMSEEERRDLLVLEDCIQEMKKNCCFRCLIGELNICRDDDSRAICEHLGSCCDRNKGMDRRLSTSSATLLAGSVFCGPALG